MVEQKPATALGTTTNSKDKEKLINKSNGAAPIPTIAGNSTGGVKDDIVAAGASGKDGDNSGNVTFTIKIGQAKNIRGTKGEKVSSFVRVQFADFDYKDSPVVNDTGNPNYGFVVEQVFHVDETLIDTFSNKRVVVTLYESLPKEKTLVLGTTEISVASLVRAGISVTPTLSSSSSAQHDAASARGMNTATVHNAEAATATAPVGPAPSITSTTTHPITYINTKLLPATLTSSTQPELTLTTSLSVPLLMDKEIGEGNFVGLRVADLIGLPEEWTVKEGTEKDLGSNIYTYTLSFHVPSESTLERLITIPGGTLVTYEAPAYTTAAAAAGGAGAVQPVPIPAFGAVPILGSDGDDGGAGSGGASGGSGVVGNAGSGGNWAETGDAIAGDSAAAVVVGTKGEAVAMQTYRKVSWNATYVMWMPPEAVVRLREKIASKSPLEIEFYREFQPKFAHLTDPNPSKYRGRVIIDVSSLLFPRVMGLRGRFALDSYDPPPCTPESGEGSGGSGGGKSDGAKGKGKGDGKVTGAVHDVDMAMFKNLGTHIGIEINVEKPLLDKKRLLPISKSVGDFIPRRTIPFNMLYEKRSEKADDDYRCQVQDVVRTLIKEYRVVLSSQLASTSTNSENYDEFDIINAATPQEDVQRHKMFLYHLNKSGAYFSLKEQLKSTVVNIVRERFQKKSPFATKAELQLFMSEVYVYLVDQMHIAINKMFKDPENAFIDPTVSKTADFSLLKTFADQAEFENSLQIAAIYHQERMAKYGDSMQTWFDYGGFCMRNGMSLKGEECYREILSRNPKHIPSLLAYGAICVCAEKFEEARVYLSTALEYQPKYCLAFVIMGLFTEVTGEELESERFLTEAARVKPADVPCMFLHASNFLIQVHAGQLAERALSHALLTSGPKVEPYLLLSSLEMQRGNNDLAIGHIQGALEIQQDDPNVWSALGHVQYVNKMFYESRMSYETVLSLPTEPKDVTTAYIRLGTLYLMQAGSILGDSSKRTAAEIDFAKKAKSMFLRSCEAGPSAKGWLGVGKACIILEALGEAEDALAEANVLNNRDSDVWAYLTLLCLMQDRQFEANQCISQALHQGIKDPEILRLVGQQFLEQRQAAPATECFRMALELDPNSSTTKTLFTKALALQSTEFLSNNI